MSKTAAFTCQSCGAGVVINGGSGKCEYCGSTVSLPVETEDGDCTAAIPDKPKITGGRLVLKGRRIKSLNQIISLYSDNELEEVITLDLSGNLLESLEGIKRFKSVRVLCLNNNRLTSIDQLPESVGSLSVKGNLLGGFKSFSGFDHIVELDICNNGYEFLPELPPRLTRLDASNNSIECIESVAKYTSLNFINLNHNRMSCVPVLPPRPWNLMVYMEHNVFEYLDDVSIDNISCCEFKKTLFISLKNNSLCDFSSILRISFPTFGQIRDQQHDKGEENALSGYNENRFFHIHFDKSNETLTAERFDQELTAAEDGVHLKIYPDRPLHQGVQQEVVEAKPKRLNIPLMVLTGILASLTNVYLGYKFFNFMVESPGRFGWIRLMLTSAVIFSAGWIGVYISHLILRPNGIAKAIGFIFYAIPAAVLTGIMGPMAAVGLAIVLSILMLISILFSMDIFTYLCIGYSAVLVIIGSITIIVTANSLNDI
ncbi:MAG TPA: hypothetical protein P5295_13765 [Spirochaetota bacterium]|nr:hypothetical protein [Spirochaetota bacterium]